VQEVGAHERADAARQARVEREAEGEGGAVGGVGGGGGGGQVRLHGAGESGVAVRQAHHVVLEAVVEVVAAPQQAEQVELVLGSMRLTHKKTVICTHSNFVHIFEANVNYHTEKKRKTKQSDLHTDLVNKSTKNLSSFPVTSGPFFERL